MQQQRRRTKFGRCLNNTEKEDNSQHRVDSQRWESGTFLLLAYFEVKDQFNWIIDFKISHYICYLFQNDTNVNVGQPTHIFSHACSEPTWPNLAASLACHSAGFTPFHFLPQSVKGRDWVFAWLPSCHFTWLPPLHKPLKHWTPKTPEHMVTSP